MPIVEATPENAAPFGHFIGVAQTGGVTSPFYGDAVTISSIPGFVCKDADVVLATLNRRPLEARFLERHALHTQAFLPISNKPFVALMAPPAPDKELPDLQDLVALRFDGRSGFVMHRGTWHEFPFAVEDGTDLVVVLSKSAHADLAPSNVHENEAHGPDLDKKDVVARLGIVIELSHKAK